MPFLKLIMDIAAIVPINVEMKADRRASRRVVPSASMIDESDKSCAYHLNVKPPHLDLDLEALKDNTIKTAIGA